MGRVRAGGVPSRHCGRLPRPRRGQGVLAELALAAWEDITISIERIDDLDDRVLTLGAFHMTGSGRGAHPRSFATWDEALEAAGLSE